MQKEVIDILQRPFKKSEIKEREGSFGKMLSYVEGHAVIQRLNEAFGSEWSFEIMNDKIISEHLVVTVRLSVQTPTGVLVKDAYGGKKLNKTREKRYKDSSGKDVVVPPDYLDISSDYKAASTDALKKAATLFGVALDLYGDGADDADEKPVAKPTPKKEAPQEDTSDEVDGNDGPANAGQKAAINNLVKKSGKDLAAVLKKIGAKDMDSLTVSQAGKAITELQAK